MAIKSPTAILHDGVGFIGSVLKGAVRRLQTAASIQNADGSVDVSVTGTRLDVSAAIDTALPAGTNNIGDVDVLTVPAPLSTTGGGPEATALRVTLATDSTGLVSVDDNGGSLTVDTPQLPGALVGGRLDENIGAWLGSTTPTVGQKTKAASLPVVMASDQDPIAVTFNVPNSRSGVASGKVSLGGSTSGNIYPLRATPYVEPASAGQRSFASTSASDTAAGVGARTVSFTYFDNTGAGPFVGTVTLSGTTPVNTSETDIRFIEKIKVETVGSSNFNVGVISMYTAIAGGGTVLGSIGVGNVVATVGDNSTLWAHHYVPAGWKSRFSVLVTGIQSGGSGTNGQFLVRSSEPLVASSAQKLLGDIVLAIGTFERSFTYTPQIDGFAKVIAYVVPGGNNATCHGAFDWSEEQV